MARGPEQLPPATFIDGRYLVVACAGGLLAFALGQRRDRLTGPVNVLDAVGLSMFAVTSRRTGAD